MSEEKNESIECGICGRVGGPVEDCTLCAGNQRYIQPRSFTLTEERQGKNDAEKSKRYGLGGEVGPKIVTVPGGNNPSQG